MASLVPLLTFSYTLYVMFALKTTTSNCAQLLYVSSKNGSLGRILSMNFSHETPHINQHEIYNLSNSKKWHLVKFAGAYIGSINIKFDDRSLRHPDLVI